MNRRHFLICATALGMLSTLEIFSDRESRQKGPPVEADSPRRGKILERIEYDTESFRVPVLLVRWDIATNTGHIFTYSHIDDMGVSREEYARPMWEALLGEIRRRGWKYTDILTIRKPVECIASRYLDIPHKGDII